jgi:hypothetical protein
MSKQLEELIKANCDQFDDLPEPGPELWGRIEKGLQQNGVFASKKAKTFSLGFVLKLAAAIVLFMGIGFAVYVKRQGNRVDYAAINPEYARQQIQYIAQVQEKRVQLKTLGQSNPELYQEFNNVITRMDSTYRSLNKDLTNSPNQERVLQAMIRNLQIQTEVLNQQLKVIRQVDQLKNQKENETKGI